MYIVIFKNSLYGAFSDLESACATKYYISQSECRFEKVKIYYAENNSRESIMEIKDPKPNFAQLKKIYNEEIYEFYGYIFYSMELAFEFYNDCKEYFEG